MCEYICVCLCLYLDVYFCVFVCGYVFICVYIYVCWWLFAFLWYFYSVLNVSLLSVILIYICVFISTLLSLFLFVWSWTFLVLCFGSLCNYFCVCVAQCLFECNCIYLRVSYVSIRIYLSFLLVCIIIPGFYSIFIIFLSLIVPSLYLSWCLGINIYTWIKYTYLCTFFLLIFISMFLYPTYSVPFS